MIETKDDFVKTFKAARRVSTPLMAVRTPDPASAIQAVRMAHDAATRTPLLHWDIVHGLAGLNKPGREETSRIVGGADSSLASVRPSDVLEMAEKLSEDAILIFANAHRFLSDPVVVQGIWNLRDGFKANGRMFIMLTIPGAVLPPELAQDALVLDEPLPSADDLLRIIKETFSAAALAEPEPPLLNRAMDALLGLAAFPAEQSLAMSLTREGLDTEALWERKRQVIEQTPGMRVWRGGESFDQIGGCSNIKSFLNALLSGAESPRVVVFVDEIEKAFAGTGTDLSGVKTEMTGTILTWMQDREADGLLLLGPPGAAKSAMAKATGNSAGIPTISFDLAAMQNSLVGASAERLRSALQIVDAVSQGRSLWIATCNSITSLPPELRRRFTLGTFFFDLPTAEERETIWQIYLKKFGVDGELPEDGGWTGAEIKECCRKSARLKVSLREAANYIVPVSRSAAEQIKSLRMQASGKFISASFPGVYQYEDELTPANLGGRFIRMTSYDLPKEVN
jgi:hypothetical protein